MFEHNVGVARTQTFERQQVDGDCARRRVGRGADRTEELDVLEQAARDREDAECRSAPTRKGGHACRFFRDQPFAICRALGVKAVEGERPGSTDDAAALRMPIAAANAAARRSRQRGARSARCSRWQSAMSNSARARFQATSGRASRK